MHYWSVILLYLYQPAEADREFVVTLGRGVEVGKGISVEEIDLDIFQLKKHDSLD
jgi:hypothetical protein